MTLRFGNHPKAARTAPNAPDAVRIHAAQMLAAAMASHSTNVIHAGVVSFVAVTEIAIRCE
jgi:hypothetical protein